MILPGTPLITVYKAFVTVNLDYGDILYDKVNHNTFCNIIESIQFNAFLL